MTHFAFVFQDGDFFVAKSPEGVASQGATRDEAIENLKEALELYYEDHEYEFEHPSVISFEMNHFSKKCTNDSIRV